ncbi:oxidoreductase [Chryseobacterium ginsenosidimutans]|uniref:SDR family NAD(P)-dependent oxidoreductase n=1 Tax=Chryseobacterium ginsenosidimutans TaxID=687846 RepID=UPI0031D39C07
MKNNKIWLITGASQGIGFAAIRYLLSKNQTIIATTRNVDAFDKEVIKNPNLEVISLDLTNETAVENSISYVAEKYGTIDLLINNAGYGFVGAIEEAYELDIAKVLSINVEVTLRMTRFVLPIMRKAGSGHIINLSSVSGLASSPGFGIYNAAKYAVEGLSEALYHEVKDLGIKVTIIEPGAFRTNFLDSSLVVAKKNISDYDATAGNFRNQLKKNNGHQPGNPEKAAEIIFEISKMSKPPLRLLLGKDAYNRATKKLNDMQIEIEQMKSLTLSTDF